MTAPRSLSRSLLLLMAVATGLSVAGNYYAQPLLSTIAQDLGLTHAQVTYIVTTAQGVYGVGLLFLVPLADMLERRSLIVAMMLLAASGLVVSALAPSLPWLLAGTAITALCSVVAQVLVPFVATLAAPAQRGRAVGTVVSGLLLGILLARTAAGALSSLVHWRAVYVIAAVLLAACAIALGRALPRYRTGTGLSYWRVIGSVIELFVHEPVLRLRSILGMLSFALFSLFWTPLAFLLTSPPYDFSDATIGLFGLAGAAGALAANWAGRLADKGKGNLGMWVGLISMLVVWLPLGLAQMSLLALVVGVLVLDLAIQMVHVGNQNAIYALHPEARNRLNAGYMTCYFIGGALGSWMASHLYSSYGWMGIVCAGVVLSGIALAVGYAGLRRR